MSRLDVEVYLPSGGGSRRGRGLGRAVFWVVVAVVGTWALYGCSPSYPAPTEVHGGGSSSGVVAGSSDSVGVGGSGVLGSDSTSTGGSSGSSSTSGSSSSGSSGWASSSSGSALDDGSSGGMGCAIDFGNGLCYCDGIISDDCGECALLDCEPTGCLFLPPIAACWCDQGFAEGIFCGCEADAAGCWCDGVIAPHALCDEGG